MITFHHTSPVFLLFPFFGNGVCRRLLIHVITVILVFTGSASKAFLVQVSHLTHILPFFSMQVGDKKGIFMTNLLL